MLFAACETAAPASRRDLGRRHPSSRSRSSATCRCPTRMSTRSLRCRRSASRSRPRHCWTRGSVPVDFEEFDLAQRRGRLRVDRRRSSFVGVIVGPGVNGDEAELDTDLPVLSLSGLGAGDGRGAWVRMVAPLARPRTRWPRGSVGRAPASSPRIRARSVVRAAVRGPARCNGTDRRSPAAATVAGEAGCDVVIWAGGRTRVRRPFAPCSGTTQRSSAVIGSSIPTSCRPPDPRPRERSRSAPARTCRRPPSSPHEIHPGLPVRARRRARGVCGRGLGRRPADPAGCGRSGVTRALVARSLGGLTTADGLEGTRRFAADGEPLEPRALLRLYRVEGGRWVRAGWDEI